MGEIVRVLKWRLDLDSAGMAEGVDKAATSAERLAKAATEVGDKGTAGLKKVSVAAEETGTAFEGLGYEAQQVEMYVSRLEKGSGSPLVLKRNAELAEAAFNVLAQSAQKVGEVIPEAFSDRVAAAIGKATTQAAGMNAELEKMGGQTPTKLDKVISALEKTEAGAADAWAAIRQMGEEGAKAAAALDKLAAASDSPRELQRNAALAELEMNQLREAIDRARASGAQLGPDVGASLNKATSNITAANTRAAQLRDTLGDMKTRGDLAAKGFEATAGAAGSLDGMLGRLIDTGGKTEQAIAKVGFSILALGAAAKMGYTEGEKLRKVLEDLGVPLPNFSDGVATAYVNLEKFARSTKESEGVTKLLSGSLVDMVMKLALTAQGYDSAGLAETAAIGRARQILALREALAASERALADAQTASGLKWTSASAAQEKWLAQLAAAELALSRASSSTETYNKTLLLNEGTLKALAEGEQTFDTTLAAVAPRVAAAVAALEALSGAHDKGAGSAKAHAKAEEEASYVTGEAVTVTVENEEAILAQAEAYEGSAAAADDAANAQRDHTTAVQQAEAANQDFGTSLDYVAQKVVETGGTLTAGQPILLSITRATREMTEALLDAAIATGKLRAEQAQALDATRGWTDYVLALKAGYDSGVTSLGSYMQQLIAFKAQITQMFAGATGEAKEAVTALQDLIQSLMGSIGPRAAGSGNRQIDDLNRAIEAAKGRK